MAYTIRSDAEVRKPDEIFESITDAEPDPEMISIAEKIIDQREGPFGPSQFVDRYEDALKKLIADKQKGRKVTAVEEAPTNVVDLMAPRVSGCAGCCVERLAGGTQYVVHDWRNAVRLLGCRGLALDARARGAAGLSGACEECSPHAHLRCSSSLRSSARTTCFAGSSMPARSISSFGTR